MRSDYMTIKKVKFWRIIIGVLIAVFILSFDVGAFAADVAECDHRYENGENVTLNGNLSCSENPALTIVGPARLNLKGYTLTCTNGKNGINVEGKGAIIHNGTVTNCKTAVDVKGDGHHQILNLTVDHNNNGIRLEDGSAGNHVINNIATYNSSRGIRVDEGSDGNKVINNFAEYNGSKGIRIQGDNNNIVGNEANYNAGEDFQITGNNNRLVNNIANANSGTEIDECFLIEGDENQLINNQAMDCSYGILLFDGAEDNSVTNNTALKNKIYDLVDENCDNNVWKNNTFENSDGTCIR